MATLTAQVAATTSPNDWNLAAGASKVAAVTSPDDDATTYLSSGSSSDTIQTFTVSPALSTGDTITQIDITARARRSGGSNANFKVGYAFTPNGGGSQSDESSNNLSTNSWTDFTSSFSSLSVVWGSALTIYIKNTQAKSVDVTTLNITITYTPGGGGGSAQPPRTLHQVRMRINA